MSNYNDGKWHNWDMSERCPVHHKSRVNTFFIHNGNAPDTQREGHTSVAGGQAWENVIAFRVVDEYKEPREFWYVPGAGIYKDQSQAMACQVEFGGEVIHLREVSE